MPPLSAGLEKLVIIWNREVPVKLGFAAIEICNKKIGSLDNCLLKGGGCRFRVVLK